MVSVLSTLAAMLASLAGLLLSPATRDYLVTTLGGVSATEFSAYSRQLIAKRPAYRIFIFGGLGRDDCLAAIGAATTDIGTEFTANDANSYSADVSGILFSLEKAGEPIAFGGIDCHVKALSDAPGHLLTLVVISLDALPDKMTTDATNAFVTNFRAALVTRLPAGVTGGAPTPFAPGLDDRGRLIIADSYLGRDIVAESLSDLDPVTLRDVFKDTSPPSIADLVRLIREDAGLGAP